MKIKGNKHLSLEERSKISVLQSSRESVRSIARILGRSPSTISRELNRPQVDKFRGNYIASTTHARVQELWKNSHKRQKTILKQRNVRDFIEKDWNNNRPMKILNYMTP